MVLNHKSWLDKNFPLAKPRISEELSQVHHGSWLPCLTAQHNKYWRLSQL